MRNVSYIYLSSISNDYIRYMTYECAIKDKSGSGVVLGLIIGSKCEKIRRVHCMA